MHWTIPPPLFVQQLPKFVNPYFLTQPAQFLHSNTQAVGYTAALDVAREASLLAERRQRPPAIDGYTP
jgi:hypothetical protein